MQNLKMFCICIHNELLTKVKKINYIPVGLGNDQFDVEWLRDNTGENISKKNKFYGEYTLMTMSGLVFVHIEDFG